jgi:diguanylate cyclase (GGDEF)-like protein/PAS domain S-box-containing protein
MPGWVRPSSLKIAFVGTLLLMIALAALVINSLRLIEDAMLAREEFLRDNLALAIAAIVGAMLLLGLLGYWFARELRQLHRATESIAAGDLSVQLPQGASGELGESINTIVAKLAERVEQVKQSESRFHAIADYTYSWETWLNAEGRLIWTNASVERVTGYTSMECLLAPDFPQFLVHPDDWPRVRDRAKFSASVSAHVSANAGEAEGQGARGQDFEFRILRKDGSVLWVTSSWQPIYGEDGTYLGTRESALENQGRKEAELKLIETVGALQRSQALQQRYFTDLQAEHAQLSSLLSVMNLGVMFMHRERKVAYCNLTFKRMFRLADAQELVGSTDTDIIKRIGAICTDRDAALIKIERVLKSRKVSDPFEIGLNDGKVISVISCPVPGDRPGHFSGRLWLLEDVTERHEAAEKLIYLAERDALTGLFNRHRFQEEMERMLAEASRRGCQLGLLSFDLDGFKPVNDNFGHQAGDTVLVRVATEIGGIVRRNEIFCRLGGDEFSILALDIEERELTGLAERIVNTIAQAQFVFSGQPVRVTTSMGIAIYPQHAANAIELIAHCDSAMYRAKASGKNIWSVYQGGPEASSEQELRLSMNERINHAIDNGLLRLEYQGVFDIKDGRLVHQEALLRMLDRDGGARRIMPDAFIPNAERSGKILEIDRWVITQAIQRLALSVDAVPVAINISGRSFDAPELPGFIASELTRQGVDSGRLYIELTETSAVSDLVDAQRFIAALRETGCRVCMDDFGVGFSSFAYIKHLKVDILKIDGMFIRNLAHDRDNQVFVKAIVDVARGLSKITVAESVEDAATLEMLKGFGVDLVQGYFLERPHEEEEIAASKATH